jgi:hypothetical protein
MSSKAIRLAALLVLVLATSQTVTGALALEHGDGAVTGSHFGHGPFGGRKHHRIVIIPYPGFWSDSDYDDQTDAYGNIAVYPPPARAVRAPETQPACHRASETFNVPSAEGGTREITVIGCP